MNMQEILDMMRKKFGGLVNPGLLILEDGSGRITDNAIEPYKDNPLIEFGSIADLVEKLKEYPNRILP